jgi:hypothetical protein
VWSVFPARPAVSGFSGGRRFRLGGATGRSSSCLDGTLFESKREKASATSKTKFEGLINVAGRLLAAQKATSRAHKLVR